jgi:crossover junction endodeoxyribonuclease RuvC
MRILGIDPGTWRTGVGIIEAQGSKYQLLHWELVSIKKNLTLAKRLHHIHQSLCAIIKAYRPDVLALESVFFGKDVQAMVKIGEARACAMLAASEHGIDVVEYPPARVKQSVSGNGRATKEQIQQMIKTLLNMKEAPQVDSSDALAIAICHLHSHKKMDQGHGTRDQSWTAKVLKQKGLQPLGASVVKRIKCTTT